MSKSNYLFAAFYLSSAIFLSGCSNAVTSSGEPVSPITTKQTRDTLEQTKMIENGAIEKNQENLYGIQKKPGEHAFSTTFRRRVRYLEGNNLEIPIPDGYKLEGCTINYIIVTASQCELWVAPTYVNTEYVLVDEVYNPDIDDYECNQAGRVITEDEFNRRYEELNGYAPTKTLTSNPNLITIN